MTLPVSVVIATKNEAQRIARCIEALGSDFSEILVVDSGSRDQTKAISQSLGAVVYDFQWNGRYPKKRQWCLDSLPLKNNWVLFIDADEIVTPSLLAELKTLAFDRAGYFLTGRYTAKGKVLRFGAPNQKIALFDRSQMMFPVVDDLDIPGMGEMEGHYQPVLRGDGQIGALKAALLHDTLDDQHAWVFRHEKYARWEAGMNMKQAWPQDPVALREFLKAKMRSSKFRAQIYFAHAYIAKLGFLDGKAGLDLAKRKSAYYQKIQMLEQSLKS